MAFLRRDLEEREKGLICGPVHLRHPELRDYGEWAALREKSRAFLQPWEPTWRPDELSLGNFRTKLRRYEDDLRGGRGYAFFVFQRESRALVGAITLSRVQRGVVQSGVLGYWVGLPYRRRGYTSAAARALALFAFEELGLHRVEAACQPDNAPSRKLLLSLGFREEGLARSYLKIDGQWRDHVLFGMLSEDLIEPSRAHED